MTVKVIVVNYTLLVVYLDINTKWNKTQRKYEIILDCNKTCIMWL